MKRIIYIISILFIGLLDAQTHRFFMNWSTNQIPCKEIAVFELENKLKNIKFNIRLLLQKY